MSSAQKCTLDLSQARPACLPRLSQESVLAFHPLSPLSRSHAFCFGFGPGLLLCLQGEAAGHLLLHIKTSPPSIWPGRGDPGETSLPWQRVSSQAHRLASSAACAVGQSQSQPAGTEGEGESDPHRRVQPVSEAGAHNHRDTCPRGTVCALLRT